ncbi:tRNA (guanosine(46)-N7)-methyltransferase TrmB [Aestuariicella hydrocarbonica]|uniref:tRNA (guanine-N(7)-)-methyltransferase n=1 Tax=Pseudomaricurvus hydrocarbonicus TaxID=1470433 RepID=A0A9E5MPK5_9GAMM|nr:tRNA (guanosine(46)-N7)-methyltransferase TrmB [Aestuariicella hydrocarbonica]NHO67988.1 tRNA (guanosine(46)-N7)-methyltransferase TrmB [Aestuariicella hydrocarbonica]
MTETLNVKPEFKKKSIRSYVIRGGRITVGQKNAFDSYWGQYGVSLFDGLLDTETAFARPAPVVLEIGFGMGDSLFAMAESEADKNFIGIEVHPPGVGCLINNAGKAGLTNLKVYMADAIDVLDDCIADGSLDRFQLYFPDPWHKKKHNKRRIVQPAFVEKIKTKLKVGGLIHMATDWNPYAEHMMEVLTLVEGIKNLAGDYQYSPRPDFRPVTKFEKRGERLGHGVWDLMFEKTA